MNDHIISLLEAHDIKPTGNRIAVARALDDSGVPLSLREIEETLVTYDRSSISRALAIFREHHLVHAIEDGSDSVRYELCRSHTADTDSDLHAHFYCERCHRTICLDGVALPSVPLPDGYRMTSLNYIIKGICPACRRGQQAESALQ